MITGDADDAQVPPSLPPGHLDIKRGLIEMVGDLDRAIAALHASRAATLSTLLMIARREAEVALADPETSDWHTDVEEVLIRSTAAEIGVVTRTPDRTVEQQMSQASLVEHTLPSTWRSWQRGEVTAAHVRVIADHAQRLGAPDHRTTFDERVAAFAPSATVARTRRFAARLVAEIDPGGLAEAHEQSAARRYVDLRPLDDGMSLLSAYLPSTIAQAAFERVTRLARSATTVPPARPGDEPQGADDAPPFAARRADALAELLLAGHVPDTSPNAAINAIRPRVAITIPALSLLRGAAERGAAAEPAWLDGTGPIPLETAKQLLANAPDVLRIVTDPMTGMPLAADTYRTPRGLRRLIEHRQPVCIAPGCSIPAADCDIDHTREYARGGHTGIDNLAPLCRRHHVLRHTTWRLERDARGRPRWTSPTGVQFTLSGAPAFALSPAVNPSPLKSSPSSSPPSNSYPANSSRAEPSPPKPSSPEPSPSRGPAPPGIVDDAPPF